MVALVDFNSMLALIALFLVPLKGLAITYTGKTKNRGYKMKGISQKMRVFLVSVIEVVFAIGASIVAGGLLA